MSSSLAAIRGSGDNVGNDPVAAGVKTSKRHLKTSRQRDSELAGIVETSYTSNPVDVPENFLKTPPSQSITSCPIDFSTSDLPMYAGMYAVVLENVLDASECAEFLRLAEESASSGSGSSGDDVWAPAMVNAGPSREFLALDYRNSDRIIWDEAEVVQRLWERCLQAPGIRESLGRIENNVSVQAQRGVDRGDRWRMTRLNERMRFLRYGPGQYFRPHIDGSYQNPHKPERSFYTLHLYLNNSAEPNESGGDELVRPANLLSMRGGATIFHSLDMTRHVDVEPKVGRVLIFQHRGLLHSGDDVLAGLKYTLRTDIMFELVKGDS